MNVVFNQHQAETTVENALRFARRKKKKPWVEDISVVVWSNVSSPACQRKMGDTRLRIRRAATHAEKSTSINKIKQHQSNKAARMLRISTRVAGRDGGAIGVIDNQTRRQPYIMTARGHAPRANAHIISGARNAHTTHYLRMRTYLHLPRARGCAHRARRNRGDGVMNGGGRVSISCARMASGCWASMIGGAINRK